MRQTTLTLKGTVITMEYKRICLTASEAEDFVTELRFEIASARCDGIQVLRIDIEESFGDEGGRKFYSYLTKILRSMKQKGIIQFFAFPDNFRRNSTEAVFLLNKYSEYLNSVSSEDDEKYLFIKL